MIRETPAYMHYAATDPAMGTKGSSEFNFTAIPLVRIQLCFVLLTRVGCHCAGLADTIANWMDMFSHKLLPLFQAFMQSACWQDTARQ
jgi:hypothetical protein